MTVREAASFYGVSVSTIYRWLKKKHGKVRGEKIDGRWHVWSGNERRARERQERMDREKPMQWPNGVDIDQAQQAGRKPEDFPIHLYPITDVRLFVPTQEWREQHDFWYGDLITEARVPPETPQHVRYLPGGNERDGWQTEETTEGFCLSSIEMQLRDADGEILQSEGRDHREGVVRALNMDQREPLWQRLTPGGPPLEGVRAYVRGSWFYLIDNGVQGHYFPAGRGYLKSEWAVSPEYRLTMAWSDDPEHPTVCHAERTGD